MNLLVNNIAELNTNTTQSRTHGYIGAAILKTNQKKRTNIYFLTTPVICSAL